MNQHQPFHPQQHAHAYPHPHQHPHQHQHQHQQQHQQQHQHQPSPQFMHPHIQHPHPHPQHHQQPQPYAHEEFPHPSSGPFHPPPSHVRTHSRSSSYVTYPSQLEGHPQGHPQGLPQGHPQGHAFVPHDISHRGHASFDHPHAHPERLVTQPDMGHPQIIPQHQQHQQQMMQQQLQQQYQQNHPSHPSHSRSLSHTQAHMQQQMPHMDPRHEPYRQPQTPDDSMYAPHPGVQGHVHAQRASPSVRAHPYNKAHSRTHSQSHSRTNSVPPHPEVQMSPHVVQQVQPPHSQQIQLSPQPQVVPVRPAGSTPREGEEEEDEREQGPEDEMNKCTHCGKAYKHLNCLWKHRWEHSKYWKSATKFMLSKHQQVQMMEAAATLLGMDESREPDQDEIVSLFCKQRGHLAPSTSTASVSPPISAKSLSASPPQQHIHLQNMQMVPGPQHPGTRHSIASTVSSLSSTPPSLAPDDESVAEIEEEPHMGHFRPPMDMVPDMKRQHGPQDMSGYPFPNAGGYPVYHQAHPSNSYHMH